MSETLKNLVKLKMKDENLSLRKAGDQAGVAHTTIDRVLKKETIDLETMEKICKWVGIPVSAVLDAGDEKSEMVDEVAALFAMNEEFSFVFDELASRIKTGELDTTILSEINAFVSYRMHERLQNGKKSKK